MKDLSFILGHMCTVVAVALVKTTNVMNGSVSSCITLRRLLQTGLRKVLGRAAGVLLQKQRVRNLTVSSFTDGFLLSRDANKSSCIADILV